MFSFLRPFGPKVKRIAPAEAVARAERGELTILDPESSGDSRNDAFHPVFPFFSMCFLLRRSAEHFFFQERDQPKPKPSATR